MKKKKWIFAFSGGMVFALIFVLLYATGTLTKLLNLNVLNAGSAAAPKVLTTNVTCDQATARAEEYIRTVQNENVNLHPVSAEQVSISKKAYWNKESVYSIPKKITTLKDNAKNKRYLDDLNFVDKLGTTICKDSNGNHNTKKLTGCHSNQWAYADVQCSAFACYMAYIMLDVEVYVNGSTLYDASTKKTPNDGYKKYTNLTGFTFKPGDIINTTNHWLIVYKVEGDKLFTLECNFCPYGDRDYKRCVIYKDEISISKMVIGKSLPGTGRSSQTLVCVYESPAKTTSGKTYKVVLDGNGSTESNATIYCEKDGSYSLPAGVTDETAAFTGCFNKAGYTFDSWNTKRDGSGKKYADKSKFKNLAELGKSVTLYAQWKPNKNTITLNGNGGTNQSTGSSGTMVYFTGESKTITYQFEKKNGILNGWNTQKDGKGKSYKNTKDIPNTVSNITLYAQWTPAYTIQYNDNCSGVRKIKTEMIAVSASDKKFISNPFSKGGYTFDGWNTRADGRGTKYKAGATIPKGLKSAGEVLTLYAQWKATPTKIPEGIYVISSAWDVNKVLDVWGKSGEEIKKDQGVQVWNKSGKLGATDQQWKVESAGDGYYFIINVWNNMCLDSSQGSTKLVCNPKSNTDSMKWAFVDAGNGSCYLHSKKDGFNLSVGVTGKNIENGNLTKIAEQCTTLRFSWKITKVQNSLDYKLIQEGTYNIATAVNTGKIFDVWGKPGETIKNNQGVQVWNKGGDKGSTDQQWKIQYAGDGYYYIINNWNKQYLDASKGTDKLVCNPKSSSNASAVLWRFYDAGSGYYYMSPKSSGKYVSTAATKVENGTLAKLSDKKNANTFKWKLTKI